MYDIGRRSKNLHRPTGDLLFVNIIHEQLGRYERMRYTYIISSSNVSIIDFPECYLIAYHICRRLHRITVKPTHNGTRTSNESTVSPCPRPLTSTTSRGFTTARRLTSPSGRVGSCRANNGPRTRPRTGSGWATSPSRTCRVRKRPRPRGRSAKATHIKGCV